MAIKIFLPYELFFTKENCDIYGEIKISENNTISYFVIASENETKSCEHLRHLGYIINATNSASEQQRRDVSVRFTYDSETPNIYLSKLSIKPPHTDHVNVFLFDAKVLQLHDCARACAEHGGARDNYMEEQCDDICLLWHLLHTSQKSSDWKRRRIRNSICNTLTFPLELITRIFMAFMEWQPVMFLLQHTVLFEHYTEWKKFRSSGKRSANIVLDKMLGICLMLILLLYVQKGDYLLQASHFIIRKLRLLLGSLKGSPIGLKLNIHLNNFLLDCFSYHIDLWATFLKIIESILRQLFVPVAFLGAMGLSFQLALLSDLIMIIGLHAHCFYIYTAVLYKVEIKGLQVLWKVVLGKRQNLLKNRIENHNYKNRQLYLATIFFTTLFFLFPTILVYYTVFTTLRLCIYTVHLVLQLQRRHILEFPLESLYNWSTGNLFAMESMQMKHIEHASCPSLEPATTQMKMSAFKLNVQSSSLAHVFSCKSGVYFPQNLCVLIFACLRNDKFGLFL